MLKHITVKDVTDNHNEDNQRNVSLSYSDKSYPNQLNYEKAILNKLVVDSKDFVGSLKELPKNLLTMFVYAYQSYLFNKILSERIKRKLLINRAIVGDIVLPSLNAKYSACDIGIDDAILGSDPP